MLHKRHLINETNDYEQRAEGRVLSNGVGGILAFCVSHNQVIRAEDLQFNIKGLMVHGQGFRWLTLIVEHVSNAAQPHSRAQKYWQNAK